MPKKEILSAFFSNKSHSTKKTPSSWLVIQDLGFSLSQLMIGYWGHTITGSYRVNIQ